jgi:DNA repair exonuclease SbcCD ATPase subunit
MGKQIKQSDISEADVFGAIGASAEKNIQKVEALNVELKGIATAVNDTIKKTGKNSEKEINILVQLSKTLNDLTTKIVKNNKAITDSEILRTKAMNAQEIALEKLRREQQKTAFEAEKQAIAINKARNSAKEAERPYNKLSARLNELRKNYKDLAVAGNENSASARKMKAEIDSLDKTLKRVDGNVGQFQRNVGNYSSAFGKMQGMLGSLGLTLGVGAVVRESFNVIKDFDQGVANLASVLGTTRSQIQGLESDAKRLGASTSFTATEVANLQTEFAKLGFTEQEILKVTEGTLSLAAATGTELARAAEVAGSTLRGFGLDASETNRVTDVMAKSFSASALDMEKFAESMKYVAPVAKVAGLSIEETTAMLGVLANAGISGSMAGTSLRQIISELDKTGKSTGEALADLAKKGLNLADAEDEVGKNAKTALLVLADQTKEAGKLTTALDKATGSSKSMADEQLNTLGGAVKLLTSAFEGYILGVNDSTKAGNGFKDSIKFIADNLPAIINGLGKLMALFAIMIIRQKVLNSGMIEFTKNLFSANRAMGEGAGNAQKFGNALKGIGFSLAIGLAIEFARSLYDVASGAQSAREQHELLQKSIKSAEKDGNKFLSTLQKTRDLNVKALQDEAKRTKMSETEYKKRLKLINDEYQFKIKGNIKYNNELKKSNKEEAQEIAKALKINATDREKYSGEFTVEQRKQARELIESLGGRSEAYSRIDALKIMIAESNEYLKVFYSELKALNPVVDEFAVVTEKTTKATEKKTKATEKEVTALREQLQLIREIEGAFLDMEADDLSGRIEQATRSQLANIQDAGSYTIDVLNDLIAKETELKKAIIERQYYDDIAGGMNIELATAKRNKAIQDLDEEQLSKKKDILDELETAQENYYNQDLDNQKDYVDKTEEFNKKLRDFSRQTADEIIQQLKRVSEERESEFDRRIDAEQRLQDQLAEQANAGNIQAQQSILASQQAEQKATIAKQKEQQKQQRLDEINILMKAIQQNVDNGDSIPVALGKAGSQVGLVKAFVKVFGNIKGFFDGTEGTLADENTPLKSGKDGHLIWADGNEKIMKGDYVKKLANAGLTKTSDIVSSAIMYQNIATKGTQVGYSIDLGSVVSKLDELQKTIKNKPETTISPLIIEGMAKGVVESHKQGNVTRLNKYLS